MYIENFVQWSMQQDISRGDNKMHDKSRLGINERHDIKQDGFY